MVNQPFNSETELFRDIYANSMSADAVGRQQSQYWLPSNL